MNWKSTVVLDKSYLYGAPAAAVRELCRSHTVLVTPALFYEVMKDDDPPRANCFRKLPPGENPVELIDHVGSLTKYEIETQRPCLPILNHRVSCRFYLSPLLAEGTFQGSPGFLESMREEERRISEDVEGFLACISFVPGWFPELSTFEPGRPREAIDRIQERVARDVDLVRHLYHLTHDSRFPSSELVDERWALVRRLQVWVMGGLEYISRYGGHFDRVSNRVIHDYLDIQYLIHGCLAGGLATRDKVVQRLFHLLLPKGNLLTQ